MFNFQFPKPARRGGHGRNFDRGQRAGTSKDGERQGYQPRDRGFGVRKDQKKASQDQVYGSFVSNC